MNYRENLLGWRWLSEDCGGLSYHQGHLGEEVNTCWRVLGVSIVMVNLANRTGFRITMDTYLCVPMRVFMGRMNQERNTRPECGWHHLMD